MDKRNSKKISIQNIKKWWRFFVSNSDTSVKLLCSDFRCVLKQISLGDSNPKSTFVYADPPYLNTQNNYDTPEWCEKDLIDLFDILIGSGLKFGISEFSNPVVCELALSHNLNILQIGERQTLKRRNTEILITNYSNSDPLFMRDYQ